MASIQRYWLQVGRERYELPTRGQNANESLVFNKALRNVQVPGAERAFLLGDGVWEPGIIGLRFLVIGEGSNPRYEAHERLDTIQANAEAATSLIREVETGEQLATDGGSLLATDGGDVLLNTIGTSRALLGLREFNVTEVTAQSDKYQVVLRWLTKFGFSTVSNIETRSGYAA